jgi:hypothetical protein
MNATDHGGAESWPAGGECPIRQDRPVTCAAFVAMREWLGVSHKRFCGVLEIGPATWAAIRRSGASGERAFKGGPPLVAAPYALIARWITMGGDVWVPPLARVDPADVHAALRTVLGAQAPSGRMFALALGRDAGAAHAWLRRDQPGGTNGAVCLAATMLLRGQQTLLPGRWKSWWAMALREARLRGISSLAHAESWRVADRVVVPAGRWSIRLQELSQRGSDYPAS